MREPWSSVFRAFVRSYTGLGALFAILAFGNFSLIGESAALDRCLARLDLEPEQAHAPAVMAYLAYKGVLWPVSLAWTLAEGSVRPLDWAFGRYDPFAAACPEG